MYAIIENGGKQYKVSEGDIIAIDLVHSAVGSELTFAKVKLLGAEDSVKIGTPDLEGAAVSATVVDEIKTAKVKGISFRRRHGSMVTKGQRKTLTRVKITGIKG